MGPLTLLCAVSGLFSVLYGLVYTHRSPSLLRSVIKTIPVAALSGISALLDGPIWLTVALGLGAVGDWFLSRPGSRSFLFGLGSFLLGHLGFIVVLTQLNGGITLLMATPWRIAAAACLVILAGWVVRKLLPHLGKMRHPVLAYVVVIFAMGIAALCLPVSVPLVFAVIGAFMFIASDAILAFELFIFRPAGIENRVRSAVLWFLYWGGQAGMTLAIVTA